MSIFDQKPRLHSRPWEWLFTGGRSTYAATDRFLSQLCESFNSTKGSAGEPGTVRSRLLALRGDFRQIMQHTESAPALQIYRHNINPMIRAIAIWLLSRHANRFVLLGIEERRDDFSPMVRKRVARALRRLEARELLAEMADAYPEDVAVQWYAHFQPNPKTYSQRLENFVNSVGRNQATPVVEKTRMPLWFRDEYWSGTPPKSLEYIRTLLKRIHSLVHGKS